MHPAVRAGKDAFEVKVRAGYLALHLGMRAPCSGS